MKRFLQIDLKIKISSIYFIKLYYCIIFSILTLTFPLSAQNQNIKFQHITIEDGLTQNTVNCIYQDKKGFMWFGTQNGLNRYDGSNMRTYQKGENPNSLNSDDVLTIFKDVHDNLWIGTLGGLNCYNPSYKTFTRYQHEPNDPNSLSHNIVYTIEEDPEKPEKFLWIGTQNGLNLLDISTGQFAHIFHNPDDPKSLSNNDIRIIYKDGTGDLWIGTAGGGLNLFNTQTKHFTRFQHISNDPNSLSNDNVYTIIEDHLSYLWIGTNGGGLNQFDRNTGRFTPYQNKLDNPNSLSQNNVSALFEDHLGNLWIGTNNGGLNCLDLTRNRFKKFQNNPYDPQSLSNDDVLSILEDRSGNLWIGTRTGGLNKFTITKNYFTLYQHHPDNKFGLSHNNVWCCYEDPDAQGKIFWIGTTNGLNRFDCSTQQFTRFLHQPGNPNSLSHNTVWSIIKDDSDLYWIGTTNGLNQYNPTFKQFTHYHLDLNSPNSLNHTSVQTLFIDHAGYLWIGTANGLKQMDLKIKQITSYFYNPDDSTSLSNNDVRIIYEDHNQVLWIGSLGGGLCRFDRGSNNFKTYQNITEDQNSLSDNRVISLHEDKFGNFWIGTGGGLNQFKHETGQFIRFMENDGLPNNVIYGILEENKGNLWLSTNKGISKFDLQTRTFKNYDISDGLQSNEFNIGAYCKSTSGLMFFGGLKGFNTFQPDSIRDNQYLPPVVITDFQIFNKSIPIGEIWDGRTILKKSICETKKIHLNYNDKVFSFEFVALSYTSPEKNKYAYLMENFEKEWNRVGSRRFASYMNLPPGEYTFRVKGSNNDGVWNEEGTSLKLYITPLFWQTLWFKIVAGFLLMTAVYFIFYLKTKSLKNREKKLQKTVQERTKKLKQSNKNLKKIKNEAQKKAIQSDLLYKIGQRVSSELETKSLFNEIVKSIRKTYNYFHVAILYLDEKTEKIKLKALSSAEPEKHPPELSLSLGDGMIGQAALTGNLQVTGNISKNPHYIRIKEETIKSELDIPLKSSNKVIGVLSIQSDKINAFDKTDITAMETLSIQIASAIENARLYEQTKRRAAQAALIYEVGKRLSSNLNFKELLSTIVTTICEAFDYYGVMMLMYNEKYEYLSLQSITGGYVGTFPRDLHIANGEGMIGQAAVTGKIQVSGDVSKDPHFVRKANEKTKSEISLPVMLGGKVIGVLDIQSETLFAFDKSDVAAMETLSTQITSAIENARLYDQAQQEIRERKKVEKELERRKMYLESVLQDAPDAIVTFNKLHNIVDWNEGARKIFGYTKEEVFGKNIDNLITAPDVKVESQVMTKQVLSGNKAPSKESIRYKKDGTPVNVIVAGSPIKIENKLHGIVAVYTDITKRKKAEKELSQKNKELETLDSVVKVINKEIDLENVLQSLLGQALSLLPQAERGSFLIYDEDLKRYRYAVVDGYNFEDVQDIHLTEEEVISRYTEHSEQLEEEVYVVGDIKKLSVQNKLQHLETPRSMLAMSLIVEDRLEGFLILVSMTNRNAFDMTDVRKSLRFREHAVSAFIKAKNLRLLEEKNQNILSSIRYGERIQNAILPLNEKICSFFPEHFILYKPRDIVSGDFYWFNQIDKKIIIAVVDCTGHGVPGAFMSMIGNTLLNEIVNEQRITDPALILENLHTEVRSALKQETGEADTQDGMDVCLCVLQKGKKSITFAGAKRPIYIVRKNGTTEPEFIEIKGNRKSIGGRQKEKKRTFTTQKIPIRKGDSVYLTSDGLIDQNNSEGKKFSSKRLKAWLKSHAHLSAAEQKDKLLVELEDFQGYESQRDDITFIGLKI